MSEVEHGEPTRPYSCDAVSSFSSVLSSVPERVPIVLEPLIDLGQSDVETELRR